MIYYGIKTNGTCNQKPYIWWISDSTHNSWNMFFQYPDKDRNYNGSRTPLAEAIQAYESIGYKCVRLEITELETICYHKNTYQEDDD